MEPTDVQLIVEAQNGKEASFAILLDRHIVGVYQFAFRFVRDNADAEDIAQETFVRAWKNLKKFDVTKNLKTWLYTIAKNASLDLLKKKKPAAFSRLMGEETDVELFLAPYIASGELPEATVDAKLAHEDMDALLAKLPPQYRAVLALRYHDQLKFREIATALHEPIDTVKSKHRRGLALLRNIIPSKES